ncbi:MAG: 50S ribosomal protein L30 [Bacteroidales bacterium]|jgi:large subunit ribosomal protein L30|nr:50S ribosomal protein L30 [Bacteroidales bacterium]
MAKINITLKKSLIHASKRQVATVKALGLGKVSSTVVHDDTPQILGMVGKVNHLVSVENN